MLFSCSYAVGILRRITRVSKLKPHCCSMASDVRYSQGADPKSRLIWVDLELTGLDVEKDHILEAACIITEENLDIVATFPEVVIHQPDQILDNMNSWCQETHLKTGLIDEVSKSSISVQKAEQMLLEFVQEYTQPGTCPLAGNTVYMDRYFLAKYMPTFERHMHYRIVDVSTIKELCRRWKRDLHSKAPEKAFIHRAMEDINESIQELRYYKKCIFDGET